MTYLSPNDDSAENAPAPLPAFVWEGPSPSLQHIKGMTSSAVKNSTPRAAGATGAWLPSPDADETRSFPNFPP